MDLEYVELPFFDGGFEFKIGIRKDYPGAAELQQKLDKAIAELASEGRFKQIRDDFIEKMK